MFMLQHAGTTIVASSLMWFIYGNFYALLALYVIIYSIAVKNTANYYMKIFSQNYQNNLAELDSINSNI